MKKYLDIMRLISKGEFPESLHKEKETVDCLHNLIEDGLIKADITAWYDNKTTIGNPRLTIKGEQKLKESMLANNTTMFSKFSKFFLSNWQWLIGFIITLCSLIIAIIKIM